MPAATAPPAAAARPAPTANWSPLGVSLANRCPFCVDAHTMMLHATGDHPVAERLPAGSEPEDAAHARAARLGQGHPDVRAPGAGPLPFPREHAPGYIGTALTFHFINRVVSALITEAILPGNAQRFRAVRSIGGRTLHKAVRRSSTPGDSCPCSTTPQPGPAWAAGTPVGAAYAALLRAAMAGAGLLDEAIRPRGATVAAWDGTHPPLAWEALPDRASRPGARLALLAALAPYRITDEDVAAWKKPPFSDHCLVHLIAFGAFMAVDRIEAALAAQHSAHQAEETA